MSRYKLLSFYFESKDAFSTARRCIWKKRFFARNPGTSGSLIIKLAEKVKNFLQLSLLFLDVKKKIYKKYEKYEKILSVEPCRWRRNWFK